MKKTIVCFILIMLTASCTMTPAATLPTVISTTDSNTLPPRASTQTYTPVPAVNLQPTSASATAPTLTPSPGVAPEIMRIMQTGGSIHGITIVDDLAYIGMGPRVGVMDISQHTNPKLVTQSEILPGLVTTLLQVSSNRLLVGAGKYLVMMDISAADEPKSNLELGLEGAIMAMALDDRTNILYIGGAIYYPRHSEGSDGFVVAFNITPEGELIRLNSTKMPEIPLSLALGENYLFAGANGYEGGLYTIQVKTPGELSPPQLAISSNGSITLVPISMQVIGDRLFIGDWGVIAFDITNPEQPAQIWRGNSTGINIVTSFTVDGNQVYVTGFAIREPDVPLFGMLTAPDDIAGSPVGVLASMTALHNGDFFVADRNLGIFTAATDQDLQRIGSYLPLAANVIDAVANDRAVFVVDDGIGDGQSNVVLWVLSLPDLLPLRWVTTEFPNSLWEGFRDITLDADRLYLATADTLWVYDISRLDPTLLGKVEFREEQITEITALTLNGKRLLFAAHSNDVFNKLNLYDLTDVQSSPVLIDSLNLDQGYGLHLILNGSTIYMLLERTRDSSSNSRVYTIDFDNYGLKLNKTLDFSDDFYHMAAGNNLIVLTGSSRSMDLSIVSILQAEPFKHLFSLTQTKAGQGVAIYKDSAIVVAGISWDFLGEAQVLIYDLRSPSYPKKMDMLDIAFSNTHNVPIVYSSPYVILVNGAGGLEVLEFSR